MPRRRPRPKPGVDDARILVQEKVHELRHTAYAVLRAEARRRPVWERVVGLGGEPMRRRTAIAQLGRGADEELAIAVQVYRDTPIGRLNPLAEDLVIATPDGEMQRDDVIGRRRDE